MKGIIFNITEAFLAENFGEDVCSEIMDSCPFLTKDPFVSPGTYPDEDLILLVNKASEKLKISIPAIQKNLGHFAFFKLIAAYPHFIEPFHHPKKFLLTVESVIHVEVRKLYRDSYLPTFSYVDPAPDRLIITYHSRRKLYSLMEGLIDGVGEYFNVPIKQTKKNLST